MDPVPELLRRKAERLLDAYIAAQVARLNCPHVSLAYSWRQNGLVLLARDGCNPPWPIACFRYTAALQQWVLFAPQGPTGWRPCLEIPPSLDLERLLSHLAEDPHNLFWPPAFTCFS